MWNENHSSNDLFEEFQVANDQLAYGMQLVKDRLKLID